MNEQAFPVIIMHLALIRVAGNGGKLCQKIDALDQCLVYVRIIRVIIVIIQGKDRVLKLFIRFLPGKRSRFISTNSSGMV